MSATRYPRHRTSAARTVRRLHTDEPTPARLAAATDTDRDQFAPPPASTTRRAGGRPRRRPTRVAGWLPRLTRGRALVVLAVSLVVLVGGTLAVGGNLTTVAVPIRLTAAQPAPTPPLPLPSVDLCTPGSPLPVCQLPTGAPLPSPTGPGAPVATTPACTGEGCIPQPATTAVPPTGGSGGGQPGDTGGGGQADCGVFSIDGCVTNAIDGFFRGIVTDALNPLLDLLSHTLLTTPTPDSLPRIGELWNNSWQILLASYALLVLIAGILVMAYETVQTRHSIKEIAPRIVIGFLAGALSLWVATRGIEIANGVAQAVMGGGVDASTASDTLKNLVQGSLNGGIFILFIGLAVAGMLIALLVTYIVRVALTIILIAGAPLALMFHALPQTEGIAKWWWKAYGGVLAIQVGQSLALITAMKVFLAPGGFTPFGPTGNGLVNLLVALALLYILFKIPFWILGSIRGGGGRSVVGSLVRGFIAYKTFGLLGGGGGRGRAHRHGGRPRPAGGGPRPVGAGPRPRRTAGWGGGIGGAGTGGRGGPRPAGGRRPTGGGGRGGPRPVPVGGATHPTSGTGSGSGGPGGGGGPTPQPTGARPRGGRGSAPQPVNPYRGSRPNRAGQYALPLGVTRTPRPASPPPPATPPRPRPRGTQLELPFDPYQGNRPTRSGQYPLPLDGVHRVPPATPAPPPPAAPPRPAPRGARQLRLPLDLPKPPKPTSGGTP
jgi:hypothetical protein